MYYIANVNMVKFTQNDNFENGCTGDVKEVFNDSFSFRFTDTNNFKEQLATWAYDHFDIVKNDFIEFVSNDVENDRFDYAQNEDNEGNRIELNEDNPNGYLCDYSFYVSVTKPIQYDFSN